MFYIDYITKEGIIKHSPKQQKILDHPTRISIVGDSGSGKTNAQFNLVNHKHDIDKMYLFAKDPYETQYQLLTNKRESTRLKYLLQDFVEYSDVTDDVYKNIEEYNPNNKQKVLIIFDDMIADMLCNKNLIQQ